MSTKKAFDQALQDVKKLSDLSNDQLLQLYGLYKQATEGNVHGPKPGLLDLKGKAKYQAWSKQKGKSREQAMEAYASLVKKLASG